MLTNKYPTAVGHLLLNGSSSHLVKTSYQDSGGQYPVFDSPQYISMLGGPHKQAGIEEGQPFEASKQFPPKGGDANIWNEKEYRTSNLGFDPQRGNTLEFWSKFELLTQNDTDEFQISAYKDFNLIDYLISSEVQIEKINFNFLGPTDYDEEKDF